MKPEAFDRYRAENFLYEEAALLDEWRLREWADLFTSQGTYSIPSPDHPSGGSDTALFLVADSRSRLDERVRQLLGASAWAENPRSRTRHLISNVRLRPVDAEQVDVLSNFVVYRFRHHEVHQYVGSCVHRLVVDVPDGPRIHQKNVRLDLESLRDVGKISIIL